MSVPAIIRWDHAYNRNGNSKLPRVVVNVIRTYMDNHTLSGWVSQETLMRDTGLSESQVRRHTKANADAGWIEVVRVGRAGKATDYRLTQPQPVMDDRLDEAHPNRSLMTGYDTQPVMDDRLQPVMDDTPTTPRTSPQEKFFSRSVAERTEAPEEGADGRAQGGPSLSQLEHATAEGEEMQSATAEADPWVGIEAKPMTDEELATSAAAGLPQSEWPPKRPPAGKRPRGFAEQMDSAQQ